MKRLQVKIDNKWEYVFCRNARFVLPIVTKNKMKAIKGDSSSLDYFQNYFASQEFKIV